ncbi:MAG: S-methyl-5-thioribose-1-phosphate isomerase [Chloroflexi bacterium]|nr:S-methyl-5-thioribose-1-phosphate isomerase [Chloroflexota bacterium]
MFKSLEWRPEGALRLLDQRRLPAETNYLDYTTAESVAEAIFEMVVRGAPAIGDTAAYGLALEAFHYAGDDVDDLRARLAEADRVLRASRPTAVNLFWALDRMGRVVNNAGLDNVAALRSALLEEAHDIAHEDAETCKQIGRFGAALVPDQANVIHHCNTGGLATMEYGTALGVIRTAHEMGKQVHVFVDETRPRLQGARLTAWELKEYGIPHQVIADGASGHFMRRVGVQMCFVGADRIAANGDTANKIGTYNLAIVAKAHNVPFYVVAPLSTVDLNTPHGDRIEIEERRADEVTHIEGVPITPTGTAVGNPAFDVTPAEYITGIITEAGVIRPPFTENLRRAFDA